MSDNGNRSWERVQVALSGVESVDLSTDSIKILGVNFTYNGDIFIEKNFCNVIEKILSPLGDGVI